MIETNLVETIDLNKPQPLMILAYGEPGVGKTSFATEFPKSIFIATENGVPRNTDISNIIEFKRIRNLDGFYQCCADIWKRLKDGSLDCKTIVIDHMGDIEKFIISDLQHQLGHSFGKGAFGTDYAYLANYMENPEKLMEKDITIRVGVMNTLRMFMDTYGINIVILAHSTVRKVEIPGLATYDRNQPDLRKQILDPIHKNCSEILYFDNNRTSYTEHTRSGETKTIVELNKEAPVVIYGGSGEITHLSKSRNGFPDKYPYILGNGATEWLKNIGIIENK